jgi:hypothetical protein
MKVPKKKPDEIHLENLCDQIMNNDVLSTRMMKIIRENRELFFVVKLSLPTDELPVIGSNILSAL